jgi:hypothetical protein
MLLFLGESTAEAALVGGAEAQDTRRQFLDGPAASRSAEAAVEPLRTALGKPPGVENLGPYVLPQSCNECSEVALFFSTVFDKYVGT